MNYLVVTTIMITATKTAARMSATVTPITVELMALFPVPVTEHTTKIILDLAITVNPK